MTVTPQGMSVQTLYRAYRDGSLVVNRQYQRKLVWLVSEKQRLIDSILRDFPLPLFLFAEKVSSDGRPAQLEIIDGMQRLNAIFSFIEQGFLYEGRAFDLKEFTRARQAAEAGAFTPLPEEVSLLSPRDCANLQDYQLAVTIYPGESEERITEVFGRINSGGKQLSDQERRQAGVLSPFAETVRSLSAEIRGDVSSDSLLLSEMPEISIETGRNPHGYKLRAEDIFWCFEGVLRSGDLRDSEDEQVLADLCASIIGDHPAEATGDYLDAIYRNGTPASLEVNTGLGAYGRERLEHEVKTTFSAIRETLEAVDAERFAFRRIVYPKPTSNAQKAPFFAIFMAFHSLMHQEGMTPGNPGKIWKALNDLTERISVGKKHTKADDREDNVRIVKGLIRDFFVKADASSFTHGPGLTFDFENSLRRSRTESARYEFKQGILRLDGSGAEDPSIMQVVVETISAIANVGPDTDGFVYIGIADKPADAARIKQIDNVEAVRFEHADIVGVDREADRLKLPLDRYLRRITDAISRSALSEPLKTNVLGAVDVIAYKGRSVVRLRVPRQSSPNFLGDNLFMRMGATTVKASGPQIAAVTRLFSVR